MAKQEWKPGNMIYPLPAVIVTCGEEADEYNGLTIAWTGTICTNPPMTYISVRPSRHSYEIIKRQKGFVINLTTEKMAKATDYLGVRSGAREDKLAAMKLDYTIGRYVKSPLLVDSPVNIECEVVEIKELGSHHMFMAKVVNVHVDEKYMDDKNRFHLEASHPIAYSHGQYFGLGEELGHFGYSVRKKKNPKAEKQPLRNKVAGKKTRKSNKSKSTKKK